MLDLVFVVIVVAGFACWMLAAYSISWAERAARTLFFAASVIWALGAIHR